MTLNLAAVAGGPQLLKDALLRPDWLATRYKTTKLLTDIVVDLARQAATDYAHGLVTEDLATMIDVFTQRNGPRPPADSLEQQEWDAAIDDEVASIVEPFAANVSAGWLGQATVDTLIHQPGEIQKFADSFSAEVWKELIYRRTPNQILSGIGLTPAMIQAEVNKAGDTPVQAINVNSVLNAIMLSMPDENELEDMLDQVSDTDELLAEGAAERLGLDEAQATTLRLARENGANPEEWAQLIVAGELMPEPDPLEIPAILIRNDNPPPAAVATTTVPPPPASATSVPPPPVGSTTVPPPPATTTTRRGRASNPPPADYIPANVLLTIKEAGAMKDEDMANIVGVSRPTMNNYLRGKGYCVPTQPQRAALLAKIEGKAQALTEAIALLSR